MRQRVGFARAVVTHPNILLMDEPFSALDVLTAETLRSDLIDLWTEGRLPIKTILMVTHNIEEAVLMCDRILVLSSHPGRIASEIRVTIAASSQSSRPGFSADGRQHLRPDDPALDLAPARQGRALPGQRYRHGAAARFDQFASRSHGGGRSAPLQRQGRPAASRRFAVDGDRRPVPHRGKRCSSCALPSSKRAISA